MTQKKQTSVGWLVEQLEKGHIRTAYYKGRIHSVVCSPEIVKQAMEMHKQQIMQAAYDNMGNNFDPNMGRAEQYYNQTYGGVNEQQ